MEVLDEKGNIFGRINIIDGLVILLILAVVIAGATLIISPIGGESTEDRYITVDLGEESTAVADRISTGANVSIEGAQQNMTVTDVYTTPASPDSSSPRVIIRGNTEVATDSDTGTLTIGEQPLQLGSEFTLSGSDYTTDGTVEEIDAAGSELDTDQHSVTVESDTSAIFAEEIEEGAEITLGGHTAASITTVERIQRDVDRQRLRMNVQLETISMAGSTQFAGQPLRPGNQITLTEDEFTINGEITRLTPLSPPEATRTVTLEFGTQSTDTIEQVSVGDTMEISESQQLTIEKLHVSPAGENQGELVAQASIVGQSVEYPGREDPVFEFAGERSRVGEQITVDTDAYTISGEITAMKDDGSTLTVENTPVLVETTLDRQVTNELAVGDTFSVGSNSVGDVTALQLYPIGENTDRVLLGVNLSTRVADGSLQFAGSHLTVGSDLTLTADTYTVTGQVRERGAVTEPGEQTQTTVQMKLENVDPDVADSLTAGMKETVRGDTIAEVMTVNQSPAVIVTESEDGELRREEHPENKDVQMTVNVQTYQTPRDGVQFHGTKLREDQSYVLDFESILVEPTVTEIIDIG